MHDVVHWLLTNGIGQNVTASVVLGVPAAVWTKIKIMPAIREHRRKLAEIHAHVRQQQGQKKETR